VLLCYPVRTTEHLRGNGGIIIYRGKPRKLGENSACKFLAEFMLEQKYKRTHEFI
jgi:hypothetical protein